MNDKKLRIGFVGTGYMGQCAHLKNYITWPDECEVVAIAEVRAELGEKVAARYGVAQVYADHRQLLENANVDAIVASQPFCRHGLLLDDLATAGKPVFIEKPLAGSIAVGEKIVTNEVKYGASHMVGYHKRSDPAMIYARGEIERLRKTGELGLMTYIRILMPEGDYVAGGFSDLLTTDESVPGSLPYDPPASDMDEETLAHYIAFVNYYIHQVNLMRFLLCESYQIKYANPAGILLAGESESGVACAIEMSPYRTRIDWQEQAFVCFEKGWIRIDLPAPLACNRPGRVTIHREPEGKQAETVTPQLPMVHAMRQQALNFIRFCRGEIPATCSAAEALDDLKIAREFIRLRHGK